MRPWDWPWSPGCQQAPQSRGMHVPSVLLGKDSRHRRLVGAWGKISGRAKGGPGVLGVDCAVCCPTVFAPGLNALGNKYPGLAPERPEQPAGGGVDACRELALRERPELFT